MNQSQDRAQTLQSAMLNQLRRQRVPVTIHLVNGIKLQGSISAFDQFSILLRRGDRQRLVYKHAVTTVEPDRPVSLDQGAGGGAEGKRKAPEPRHPGPRKERPASGRPPAEKREERPAGAKGKAPKPAPAEPPAAKKEEPAEGRKKAAEEPAPSEPPAPKKEEPAAEAKPGGAPEGGEGPGD